MSGDDRGERRRRALLWALYFVLMALADHPSFMGSWSAELGEHLGAEPDPTGAPGPAPPNLRRVK